jgi:hypothetical protein
MRTHRKLTIGGAAIVGALCLAGDASGNPPHPASAAALGELRNVQHMLASWPEQQRQLGTELMVKYGAPVDHSEYVVVWTNSGPFSRSILYRYGIDHNFPSPHSDVLEQVVNYRVPPDKVGELAQFDGSITVLRTGGELSVRGDREDSNILELNLAVEIAEGKRTVASARKAVADAMLARLAGEPVPLMQQLTFTPGTKTADPDQQIVTAAQLRKAGKRQKLRQIPARESALN